MELSALPEAIVEIFARRFIVANVTSVTGETKIVLRAIMSCDCHFGILLELEHEVEPHGLSAICMGGGFIEINPGKKTVRIWGESKSFGMEPDREQTARILQAAFPEYGIIRHDQRAQAE